jgi:hypothetical protein
MKNGIERGKMVRRRKTKKKSFRGYHKTRKGEISNTTIRESLKLGSIVKKRKIQNYLDE